jgi:hypothetical protein
LDGIIEGKNMIAKKEAKVSSRTFASSFAVGNILK